MAGRVSLQLGDFQLKHLAAAMVLITQVEVAGINAHHLCSDQHTLQKTVWVALQVSAVFEGTGLALVDVHRHDTRRGLTAHNAPFAPCRETCTTQATQAGVFHGLGDALDIVFTIGQTCSQCITAVGAVHLIGGVTGCGTQRFTRNAFFNKIRRYKIDS